MVYGHYCTGGGVVVVYMGWDGMVWYGYGHTAVLRERSVRVWT